MKDQLKRVPDKIDPPDLIPRTITEPPTSSSSSTLPFNEHYISFFIKQNKLMKQIIDQNNKIHQKFIDIRLEVERLRTIDVPQEPKIGPVPTKKDLLEILKPDITNFDFSLSMLGLIPVPICKGKYFNLIVKIDKLSNFEIPHEERIQAKVSVYCAENPPKLIIKNMGGENIIRGHMTSMLTYDSNLSTHTAKFKIQLNEVTSHYMNS